MDAKLNQSPISDAHGQPAAKKKKRFFDYIHELKEELKKVSWTTKDELRLSTKIVIGSTFFFGMAIYLFDLAIKGLLDLVATVAKLIFG